MVSRSLQTLAVCSMSPLIAINSFVISKSLRDTLEPLPVVKASDTHFHTIQCSASRSPWQPRDWRHSENRDIHFFSGGITYLLSAATVLWLKRKLRIVLQHSVACTFYNKSFTSKTWRSMIKEEAGGRRGGGYLSLLPPTPSDTVEINPMCRRYSFVRTYQSDQASQILK